MVMGQLAMDIWHHPWIFDGHGYQPFVTDVNDLAMIYSLQVLFMLSAFACIIMIWNTLSLDIKTAKCLQISRIVPSSLMFWHRLGRINIRCYLMHIYCRCDNLKQLWSFFLSVKLLQDEDRQHISCAVFCFCYVNVLLCVWQVKVSRPWQTYLINLVHTTGYTHALIKKNLPLV